MPKFSNEQKEFMGKIGLKLDFENLSSEDMCNIEDSVADELQINGFDQNYEVTETGKMCESILDMMND